MKRIGKGQTDKGSELVTVADLSPAKMKLETLLAEYQPPQLVRDAGEFASFAYAEFFATRSGHTRTAYRRNVDRFLSWLSGAGLTWNDVNAPVLAEYLDKHLVKENGQPLKDSSKKQHLAALRKFYRHQERRHGVVFNPAAAVEGPKLVVRQGLTKAFPQGGVKRVLDRIDTSTVIGQRDRAIIAALYWTAARAGAIADLRLEQFYSDGDRWWFDFGEKGGKPHRIKASHTLQLYMLSYIEAAGIARDPRHWHLFRSAMRRIKGQAYVPSLTPYVPTDALQGKPARGRITGNDILRLVKRRVQDAGLPAGTFTAHSFRKTTATHLRRKGVPRDKVQLLLGHADARTTDLYYDQHRSEVEDIVDEITLDQQN